MVRVALLALLLFLNADCGFNCAESSFPARENAKIKKVYDGDTVLLEDGRIIRLIGIDSPETNHPTLPIQRFGKEATAFATAFAEGRNCELEFEEKNNKDVHGRSIAYVYIGENLLNAELLKGGFAYVYTKYPFRLKAEFIQYQKQAIKERKGLWNIKDKSAGSK